MCQFMLRKIFGTKICKKIFWHNWVCLALKRAVSWWRSNLSPFPSDAASKLNILGHDGHSFGMDGAQVGILEQGNQVRLGGLLKSHDSGSLESEISLEVLGNLSNKPLERKLADQQLRALLITTNLSQSDSPGPVPMRFLDSTCGRRRFARSLGGQLFPRSLPSGTLSGSLLGSSHVA